MRHMSAEEPDLLKRAPSRTKHTRIPGVHVSAFRLTPLDYAYSLKPKNFQPKPSTTGRVGTPSARPAHELPQHVPRPPAGVCRCIVCITEGEGAHARACAKERARVIETAKKKGEREKNEKNERAKERARVIETAKKRARRRSMERGT